MGRDGPDERETSNVKSFNKEQKKKKEERKERKERKVRNQNKLLCAFRCRWRAFWFRYQIHVFLMQDWKTLAVQ